MQLSAEPLAIGQLVREMRQAIDLSQEKIADELGRFPELFIPKLVSNPSQPSLAKKRCRRQWGKAGVFLPGNLLGRMFPPVNWGENGASTLSSQALPRAIAACAIWPIGVQSSALNGGKRANHPYEHRTRGGNG